MASYVWQFMKKLSNDKSQCTLCGQVLNYTKTSTSNMRRHLFVKHPEVCDGIDNRKEECVNVDQKTSASNQKPSIVWSFMVKESSASRLVTCQLCNHEFSFDGSTSPLLRHLKLKHKEEYSAAVEEGTLPTPREPASRLQNGFNQGENMSDSDEDCVPLSRTGLPTKPTAGTFVNGSPGFGQGYLVQPRGGVDSRSKRVVQGGVRRARKPVSCVWKFMVKDTARSVRCRICNHIIKYDSYEGSTSHMLRHLRVRHRKEFANASELPDEFSEDEDPDEEDVHDSLTNFSEKSMVEESVHGSVRLEQEGLEQARLNVDPVRSVTKKTKPKPVSIVWQFMIKESPRIAKCKICNRQLVYKNCSTTNLLKHIKRMHAECAMAVEDGALDFSSETVPSAETGTNEEITSAETSTAVQSLNGISNYEEVVTHTENCNPLFKKRIFSTIWKYMLRIGINKTMCRICKKKFNYRNGCTSEMHKHIQRNHPEELGIVKATKGKEGMNFSGSSPGAFKFLPETDSGSQRINYFVNMVVDNPSVMVEQESFIKFVHMLRPSFFVPGTEMMEKAVIKQHKIQKSLLLNQLDKVRGVSISIEIWTYRERQQYMTVTGHFVSETWDVQSAVLNTVLLDSRSDLSSSIAERLVEILNQWNIVDKVKCIVTDNTAQQNAAVAKLSKPGLHCIALALNSTVQESLDASNNIGYLATRVRDICNFFLHSVEASHKLKLLQLAEDKTPLRLERDTESDWISTYRMFNRYADLHTYLGQAASELSSENTLLVAEELELLDWCVQILEPFVLATEDLVSDNFTAVSKSLPVLEILKHRSSNLPQEVKNPAVVEHGSAIAFTNELHNRIEKWISVIGDRENFLPWATTLLDPRFKHLVVEEPEMQKWVVAQLQQLMEPLAPNEDLVENKLQDVANTGNIPSFNNNVVDISSLWSSFDETILKCVREKPVDEVQRYIEERPITRQEDPLKWWMEREHLYPKLSKIVTQFLCIPATSVPPSQIFLEGKRRNLSLRDFIEESQLDSFLFLSTCQIVP